MGGCTNTRRSGAVHTAMESAMDVVRKLDLFPKTDQEYLKTTKTGSVSA